MTDQRPCRATDSQGRPCRGWALASGWCWNHDPDRHQERHAARSKGAKLKAINGQRRKLTSAGQLVEFVSGVIQDVLAGRVDCDVARVALYGCSIQRQLIETSSIEQRLAEAERLLAASKGRQWV